MKKVLSLFLAVVMVMSVYSIVPFEVGAVEVDKAETSVYTCGDYEYTVLSDGTAKITDYAGYASVLNIPSSLDGYKVTSIGMAAFSACSSLTSITIPDSVTSIGDAAFYICDSLTSITIPDSVTSIGDDAFCCCWSLSSITIPNSVTSIGSWAFSDCSSLTSITIPNSVTSIGDFTFSFCTSLTSITIPDSVTSIGEGAFEGCSSLTSITIPESVTSIGDYAFYGCSSLTSIKVDENNRCYDSRDNCNAIIETSTNTLIAGCKSTRIPSSVTSIGDGAFSYCKSLTSITIPDSVTSIGNYAFFYCYSLTSITIPDGVTSIGVEAFYGCDSLTMYVYKDSYAHQYAIDNDIPYEIIGYKNGMRVYSDSGNLAVNVGDEINVGVSVLKDYSEQADASKVTYAVADSSVVKPVSTEIRGKVHYVKFEGLKAGKTTVTFSDSITGNTVQVPITVFNADSATFTLRSFEAYNNGTYLTNMYNLCGLFADNYDYDYYSDGSVNLSFDVYNSSFIYGAVEVYDEKGQLYDAEIINKYQENGGSFKGLIWDNGSYLVHDISNGNLFSDTYYKSKISTAHTYIEVKIPKNGYIKVSMDPTKSVVVNAVNGTDMMLQSAALLKTISGYAKNDDLPTSIARSVVESATKPGDDEEMLKALAKNIPQDGKMSKESLERFLQTYAKNLKDADIKESARDLAVDLGFGTFEEVTKSLNATYGKSIDLLFMASDFISLQNQYMDFTSNVNTGTLTILNQEGNSRTENDVTVKCDSSFSDDTAIKVFEVSPQSQLLADIKAKEPALYEAIRKDLTTTYEIKMVKNGEAIQPDSQVDVYIPIPAELLPYTSSGKITVRHIKDDGTAVDMNAKIEGNYIVFKTTHFSKFMVAYLGETDDLSSDVLDYAFETYEDGTATLVKYNGKDTEIAIPSVYDGYVVTSIGEEAFKSNDITRVEIPDSVTDIADNAFENLDCTIRVYNGSYAHEYAVENGLKYILIEEDNTLIGDVNGDGDINILDATEIQRHIAQLSTIPEDRLSCADANRDGQVNIMDATHIQRFIAQLIPEL